MAATEIELAVATVWLNNVVAHAVASDGEAEEVMRDAVRRVPPNSIDLPGGSQTLAPACDCDVHYLTDGK